MEVGHEAAPSSWGDAGRRFDFFSLYVHGAFVSEGPDDLHVSKYLEQSKATVSEGNKLAGLTILATDCSISKLVYCWNHLPNLWVCGAAAMLFVFNKELLYPLKGGT